MGIALGIGALAALGCVLGIGARGCVFVLDRSARLLHLAMSQHGFWLVATIFLVLTPNGVAAMDPGADLHHPVSGNLTLTGATAIVAGIAGGWTHDQERATGHARKMGTCPGCLKQMRDLPTHLRTATRCKNLPDELLLQLSMKRCPDCKTALRIANSRHQCPGSTQNLDDSAQFEDDVENFVAADPAQSGDSVDIEGTWLDHIPIPAPGTLQPSAHAPVLVPQPFAEILAPLPVTQVVATISDGGIPMWADGVRLEDLCRARGPRSVPGPAGADNPWIKAVRRTAQMLMRDDLPPGDEDRAWKLLMMLPKVCGGGLSIGYNEATAAFPFLTEAQASSVLLKMTAAFPAVPHSPDASRTRAVLRHIGRGEVGKAAKVLVSDGIKQLDAECRDQLDALHPEPEVPFDPRPPALGPDSRNLRYQGIDKRIKKLRRSAAPGPSGWNNAMIQEAWRVEEFRVCIKRLAQRMTASRTCPARDWLTAGHLIPLKKPDGRVRPIVVGEAFVRLISGWKLTEAETEKTLAKEQFGVGSKGGVEAVIHSIRSAIDLGMNGLLKVDFKNAFNTTNRTRMYDAVKKDAPQLAPLFWNTYRGHAQLIALDDSGNCYRVLSKTGGRQGDPLMPFVFSLSIKPLVEELAAKFAKEVVVETPDGPVRYRLLWAYLDDIHLMLRDDVTRADVMEFLNSDEAVLKYGLRVNEAKCWWVSQQELKEIGVEILGSWVGGPVGVDGKRSGGSALTEAAATRLQERLEATEGIRLHYILILLRASWFPTLGHLLRTLPTGVGDEGVKKFDRIVSSTVLSWIGDSALDMKRAKEIFRLPVRMGGLGLYSQARIRPFAQAASYVLSRGALEAKGMPLDPAMDDVFEMEVDKLAAAIGWSSQHMMTEKWESPQLQRLGTELGHERRWRKLFDGLDTVAMKSRLLENAGAVARGWIHDNPVHLSVSLRDEEVRMALRSMALSGFQATETQTGRCSCSKVTHPTHFLSCSWNGDLRTFRHHAICKTLAKFARKCQAGVTRETQVGTRHHDGQPVAIIADLVTMLDGKDMVIDVGIVSLPGPKSATLKSVKWPEDEEVEAALRQEVEHQAVMEEALPWHARRHPNARVQKLRKFRELAEERSVGKLIRKMQRSKEQKYAKGKITVTPFILSAGGAVGPSAMEVIDTLTQRINPLDPTEQLLFRTKLFGSMSCALIRSANFHLVRQARRSLRTGQ